jgi:hypothetical protein
LKVCSGHEQFPFTRVLSELPTYLSELSFPRFYYAESYVWDIAGRCPEFSYDIDIASYMVGIWWPDWYTDVGLSSIELPKCENFAKAPA